MVSGGITRALSARAAKLFPTLGAPLGGDLGCGEGAALSGRIARAGSPTARGAGADMKGTARGDPGALSGLPWTSSVQFDLPAGATVMWVSAAAGTARAKSRPTLATRSAAARGRASGGCVRITAFSRLRSPYAPRAAAVNQGLQGARRARNSPGSASHGTLLPRFARAPIEVAARATRASQVEPTAGGARQCSDFAAPRTRGSVARARRAALAWHGVCSPSG